jgi:hypothetical protein
MKRFSLLFLILLGPLIPACTPVPEQFTPLEHRVIEATNVKSIRIHIDNGNLRILESTDSFVRVNGQVLFPDTLEYQVGSSGKQLTLLLMSHQDRSSKTPLEVSIEVPEQMQVKVETGKASVWVREYHGDVEVDSTSGNVTIEQAEGALTLYSNRGNITVRDCSGKISVVGNYGTLTMQDTSGEMAASTIMGNIFLEGKIQSGDTTRLEADHGAVSVDLKADSALELHARSTSGDVTCLISGMTSTTRSCDGIMNSGGGSLSIRTVSGAVTLQLIP